MTYYDVFNGDADGICALQQLRLHTPVASTLITGVKRDIKLVDQVSAARGDVVTVLDVAFEKNLKAVQANLERGAQVHYFDHHQSGPIPEHPGLHVHIDTRADVCTSLLVDAYLQGAHRVWAVVGAFGDNLDNSARQAAAPLNLDESRLLQLRELGICLNYNGYGITLDDLYFPPEELYRQVAQHPDPFTFMKSATFQTLRAGYASDMAQARQLAPDLETENRAVYVLPPAPWANRVSGVFGNELASAAPARAHALVTQMAGGEYRISVRAPQNRKEGADLLCSAFPSGGGRKGAAGINQLPPDLYPAFLAKFQEIYGD